MTANAKEMKLDLLEILPDDMVLLEDERVLSQEQAIAMRICLEKWLNGDSSRVLVISGGVRATVVRRKQP